MGLIIIHWRWCPHGLCSPLEVSPFHTFWEPTSVCTSKPTICSIDCFEDTSCHKHMDWLLGFLVFKLIGIIILAWDVAIQGMHSSIQYLLAWEWSREHLKLWPFNRNNNNIEMPRPSIFFDFLHIYIYSLSTISKNSKNGFWILTHNHGSKKKKN